MKSFVLIVSICADGFGEQGKPASGNEGAVPPSAVLEITLELVSWKTVSNVTDDKKVVKKILKEGEGYDRPNEGAVVKCEWEEFFFFFLGAGCWLFICLILGFCSGSEIDWKAPRRHCVSKEGS